MRFLTKMQLMTLMDYLMLLLSQGSNINVRFNVTGSGISLLRPQGQQGNRPGLGPQGYGNRRPSVGNSPPLANQPRSKWWCPSTYNIYPCTCDGPQGFILFTCDRIASTSALGRVFTGNFPVQELGKLSITNSGVDTLTARTLGNVKFEYLHMKKNLLKTLDDNALARSKPTLKRLELIHNDLDSFPFSTVATYPKLEYLDLHYNSIKSVPDYAFGSNNRIKEIDLSYNKINYVGTDAFKDLNALEKLNLKFNKLTVLNNNALALSRPNPRLQIDLSSNQMALMADGAFDRQMPLVLNLTTNSLKTFPESTFLPILEGMETTQSGIIYVDDNRFRCSCQTVGWLVKLPNSYRRHVQGFICKDLGRSLETLTYYDIGCSY